MKKGVWQTDNTNDYSYRGFMKWIMETFKSENHSVSDDWEDMPKGTYIVEFIEE